MDFREGDWATSKEPGPITLKTLVTRICLLEVFPTPNYQDISLAQWLAHVPSRLLTNISGKGETFLRNIPKMKTVVDPPGSKADGAKTDLAVCCARVLDLQEGDRL